MKFGLLLPFAGRGERYEVFFEELRTEAVEAEARGFDGCFIGEHHQQDGFTSPLHVLAALSSCTRRMKLGSAVLLLPLYHPVRVAEDAAMVDVMSAGRLILGVGTGYQRADFMPFEIPFDERVGRFEEGLDVIRGVWAQERFAHRGRHFSIPEVRISPKPVQQPTPPIWGAAWTDPGLGRVVQRCDGWIADPIQNLATIRNATQRMRALAGDRRLTVALIRSAWVAPTAEQAQREYAPSALRTHAYFLRRGAYRVEHDPWMKDVRRAQDLTFERIARDRILCGSPADVCEEIARWQKAIEPDWLILSVRNGTEPSHALTMGAIARFGDDIIPAFAGAREVER